MEFHGILYFIIFPKSVEKFQVSLKSDNNNRHFISRPIHVYIHISLSFPYNEKYFTQKLWRKSKHAFCGK